MASPAIEKVVAGSSFQKQKRREAGTASGDQSFNSATGALRNSFGDFGVKHRGMEENNLERLTQLRAELALMVKREETLTLLATSPYSAHREAAQEKLQALWIRIEAIQRNVDDDRNSSTGTQYSRVHTLRGIASA